MLGGQCEDVDAVMSVALRTEERGESSLARGKI